MADGPGQANNGHGPMRIMIVEDNEALAQTTGWLVEMIGYDYRLAANGPEAIATYPDYRPDVFMIDIRENHSRSLETFTLLKDAHCRKFVLG